MLLDGVLLGGAVQEVLPLIFSVGLCVPPLPPLSASRHRLSRSGPPTRSQSVWNLDVPDAVLPSPLLLPDLSHVQVESVEALQRLDVLCVEGDVDDHQPAGDVHVNLTGPVFESCST